MKPYKPGFKQIIILIYFDQSITIDKYSLLRFTIIIIYYYYYYLLLPVLKIIRDIPLLSQGGITY
jgi:hypothetical protein